MKVTLNFCLNLFSAKLKLITYLHILNKQFKSLNLCELSSKLYFPKKIYELVTHSYLHKA